MGANVQNAKIRFGFLNSNQDAVDLNNDEATALSSVDPDKLALGTLEASSLTTPAITTPVFTAATLNGRNFRLNSGVLEYQEDSVPITNPAGYQEVNRGDTTTTGFPERGGQPSLALGNSLIDTVTPNTIPGLDFQFNPTYSGPVQAIYTVTVVVAAPLTVELKKTVGPIDTIVASALVVAFDTYIPFATISPAPGLGPAGVDGVEFIIPTYVPVLGNTGDLSVTTNILPFDGEYSYIFVNIKNVGIKPAQDIQGLPGDSSTQALKNFNETGGKIANTAVEITFPAIPTNSDEVWCYRQGPDDDVYLRIAKWDGANVILDRNPSGTTTNPFIDNGNTSGITNIIVLDSSNDESFQDLNTAIGNAAGTYSHLFEKDGRIWVIPTDRQDLVLYSRENGNWWGWKRANSFGFQATITNFADVRDPTTVGGQFTTVFTTEDGIFHITGNGTEQDPYKLVDAVSDIFVERNSLVDMNGVLMMMSRSTDAAYDTGPYGQKIYEYDLQRMIEVSARVKNNEVVTSNEIVTGATMRGSDKYIIKKANVSDYLCYHRDAKGWVEMNEADEAVAGWDWTSKEFTPDFLQRFKLGGARFFKIDFIGQIFIQFTVTGALATDTDVTLFNITTPTRAQQIHRMPSVKGRKWQVDLNSGAGTKVFDMYLVK